MFMLATISKLAIASDARTTDIPSPRVALTTFQWGSAYREQCIRKKKKMHPQAFPVSGQTVARSGAR